MTDLAREYGQALYELAEDEHKEDTLLEETLFLAKQMKEEPGFLELLATPALSKENRLQIAEESFRSKIDDYLLNFLKILIERGAIIEFPMCAEHYEKLYNKAHNIEKAVAFTAVALEEATKEKLKAKLEQVTGKTIVLDNVVDESLIGGIRIELDGKHIDDSIKTRLNVLHDSLHKILV